MNQSFFMTKFHSSFLSLHFVSIHCVVFGGKGLLKMIDKHSHLDETWLKTDTMDGENKEQIKVLMVN